MLNRLLKLCLIGALSSLLFACSTTQPPLRPDTQSYLEEGQRLFDEGYYKRSRNMLLPLACDGVPQAQYAVGYMYYYGYGVAQDTDTGYFWIKRAADQHYRPAQEALFMMSHKNGKRTYPGVTR